jgi:hypothetical protein
VICVLNLYVVDEDNTMLGSRKACAVCSNRFLKEPVLELKGGT